MVTFVKRIKTKEGINSIDLDKVKKGIPAMYKVTEPTPAVTYTANHIVIAYMCEEQKQRPLAAAKPATKTAAKAEKTEKAPKAKAAKQQ